MVNDGKLPARTLNDFSIYVFDSRELMSPDFNTDQQVQGASGVVSPIFMGEDEPNDWEDEDVNSENEDDGSWTSTGVRATLSRILEIWCDASLEDL